MTLDHFRTPHLRGERLLASHYADVRRIHSDPVVMALLGGVRSEEQTAKYLEFNLGHWAQYGHGIYIVRDLADDALVGLGCLRHLTLDDEDEIEIGYSLFEAWWGRGLGTEIARACLDLGFQGVGARSLIAVTDPANTASQRVMGRIGMTFDCDSQIDGKAVVVYRGMAPG